MNRALACALLIIGLTAAPARADDAAGAQPAVRKVVIAPFTGKGGPDARAIALEIIAGRTDRNDYTVIGHDDAEVVAKRLGVAIGSRDGRRAISAELGIDAWIDGELDGEEGELRLSDGDGARMSSLALRGKNAREELREKIWPWVGPRISEQERVVRRLQAERTRALEKVAARDQELGRQRQLVLEREQRRLKLLAAAHTLARKKHEAREAEIAHQVEIVRERELQIAREEQRRREEEARQQAELERQQAEMARQQAEQERKLAEQQRLIALEEQRRAAAAEQAALQAAASSKAAPPSDQGGEVWQPAAGAWRPQPQPAGQPTAAATWQPPASSPWRKPDSAQPAVAARPGRGNLPPTHAQQQPTASRLSPGPAQGFEPEGAEPEQPAMIEGISPETREWLLRKQRERAAAAGGGYPGPAYH